MCNVISILALAYYHLSLFTCSGQTVSLCFSSVDFSLTLSVSCVIMSVVFLSELFELFTQPLCSNALINSGTKQLGCYCFLNVKLLKIVFAK